MMAIRSLGTSRMLVNPLANFCRYCSKGSRDDDEQMSKAFIKLMRNVPQPVVVVTTSKHIKENDQWLKRGITCSSFTNISWAPPIISFAIKKPSRMHHLLEETRKFVVHVLAQNQVAYGRHFAKMLQEGEDQFELVSHELDEKGLPILQGTSAVLTCKAHSVTSIGDHDVWYGEVLDIENSGAEKQPLLYYMRTFRSVGDEMFMEAFEKQTLPFEEWTHEAHLRMSWNYIREHGKDHAAPYIKRGIQKYNEQNKDKISRGYHETVTIFYMTMVADAAQKCDSPSITFEEFISRNKHLTDPKLLWQYYSKERINNKEAAYKFLAPDRMKLPS